jgi:hypothetical protein
MSGEDQEMRRAVDGLLAEARRDLGFHLQADELVAYHAGRLSGEEEQRVQDHLVACRVCADLLLDLEGLADANFGAGSLSAADQADLWRHVQAEIGKEELAPVVPLRRPTSFAASPRWLQALAASLLVAAVGLSLWVASLRSTLGELSQPQLNTPFLDLYQPPRSEGTPLHVVPPEARVFTLSFSPPEAEARYGLEIARAGGGTVWRGGSLAPDSSGSLTLTLSRRILERGDFRVRLLDAKGERIEEYALRVEGP